MRQVSLDRKNGTSRLRKWPWRWIFPTKCSQYCLYNVSEIWHFYSSLFSFFVLNQNKFPLRYFSILRSLSFFSFNFFEVYFSSEKLDFLLVQRPGCLLCRSCFQELQYESWRIDLYRVKPLHSEKGNRIFSKSNNFERSAFSKNSWGPILMNEFLLDKCSLNNALYKEISLLSWNIF